MNIKRPNKILVALCKRTKAGYLERSSRHFLSTIVFCYKVKEIVDEEAKEKLQEHYHQLIQKGELKLSLEEAIRLSILSSVEPSKLDDVVYVKLTLGK